MHQWSLPEQPALLTLAGMTSGAITVVRPHPLQSMRITRFWPSHCMFALESSYTDAIQLNCKSGRGSKEEWHSAESQRQFQTSSIVSLAPHCTEILFALGLGHRVVGVTVTLPRKCSDPCCCGNCPVIPYYTSSSCCNALRRYRTSVTTPLRPDSGTTSAAASWTLRQCPVQRWTNAYRR